MSVVRPPHLCFSFRRSGSHSSGTRSRMRPMWNLPRRKQVSQGARGAVPAHSPVPCTGSASGAHTAGPSGAVTQRPLPPPREAGGRSIARVADQLQRRYWDGSASSLQLPPEEITQNPMQQCWRAACPHYCGCGPMWLCFILMGTSRIGSSYTNEARASCTCARHVTLPCMQTQSVSQG